MKDKTEEVISLIDELLKQIKEDIKTLQKQIDEINNKE